MKFSEAIDLYVDDQVASGRFNSKRTEHSYRHCLMRFADTVHNRDPAAVGRDDVKRYLSGFKPNTQRNQRSMLVSFFDWHVQEGYRPANPARQTRPPKQRKPKVPRMTLAETVAFLRAANSTREKRVAYLGVCAGLRRDEIRLLQGRHFSRDGWVWVTQDIAKGGRERFVPVLPDVAEVVAEIRANVADDGFVLPAQQFSDPGRNREPVDYPDRPGDGKTIWRICKRVAERAGLSLNVTPHSMRRAFADHIARNAGVLMAQRMLGHADLSTTQLYLSEPTLDELAAAVAGTSLGSPPATGAIRAVVETVGIEPTDRCLRDLDPEVLAHLESLAEPAALYEKHFRSVA